MDFFEERPRIKITLPFMGKLANVIGLLSLVVAISALAMNFSTLPAQVPTHYNALGEPDGWGKKYFIFISLGIGVVLWLFITWLESRPHLHNYSNLTADNAERQYSNSVVMLAMIKNEILCIMALGVCNDIAVAKGGKTLLGMWEMPIFVGIIFGTVFIFVVRSARLAK